MEKINFVFFGTPDVAAETLEILKKAGHIPSLIVTAPDRPAGRNLVLTPPPVKIWSKENNIPFLQPEKLDADFISEIRKNNFDICIVTAYGKIMPEDLINAPRLGSLNIHYSLLPKYRGASPVESAILHGDRETGVSIQKMIYKMDAGDIIAEEKITIGTDETTPELRKRLITLGGQLLVRTLPDYITGKLAPQKQDENLATHCGKIKKEDGLIVPDVGRPEELYNKFRAYYAWPRIYFIKDDKRIIITDAALEDGKFIIKKVIPEGKKEMDYSVFISR